MRCPATQSHRQVRQVWGSCAAHSHRTSGAFPDAESFGLTIEQLCSDLRQQVSELEQGIFGYGLALTDEEPEDSVDAAAAPAAGPERGRKPPAELRGPKQPVYVQRAVLSPPHN